MLGKHHIIVQNSISKYEFDIKRNITIIKGDSATGKTVLVDMISEYVSNGPDSGITLSSNVPCRVIDGNTWQEQLSYIQDSIVFIDEGNHFITSKDFAEYVRRGDNYYVIITRESISTLPYSVDEIYGIHSSGKYSDLKPVYHQMYRIYGDLPSLFPQYGIRPGIIIVEDSNSGYEFFDNICRKTQDIKCISASGKSSILKTLQTATSDNILIVADGAAFGSEMDKIYQYMRNHQEINLYLPESFEWLILKSNIVRDTNITNELNHTEDYADSTKYFSWERYYTSLLKEVTRDTYLAYSKSKLNDGYKEPQIANAIKKSIINIDLSENGDTI